MVSTFHCSHTTLRQALTRMVRTPDTSSITVWCGKITAHRLTCYFTSLHDCVFG